MQPSCQLGCFQHDTLAGKLIPVNEINRSTPMIRRSIKTTPIGTRNQDLKSVE